MATLVSKVLPKSRPKDGALPAPLQKLYFSISTLTLLLKSSIKLDIYRKAFLKFYIYENNLIRTQTVSVQLLETKHYCIHISKYDNVFVRNQHF